MKKWTMILMLVAITALTASAAWWGSGDKKQPPRERMRERMKERRDDRPKLSAEQREAMKAQRDAIMKLGEAARNETDPAKKEELVGQLRGELNKVADKMHEMHAKGIERAEQKLDELRARHQEAAANRDQMIEDQLQRILSGEKPEPPEGNRRPQF